VLQSNWWTECWANTNRDCAECGGWTGVARM